MGQIEIVDKLNKEIESHSTEGFELSQKDVLYVLVELRKMLDHQQAHQEYPLIKFYADWSVHTQKDHMPEVVKELLSDAEDLSDFISMENLRLELKSFFEVNEIVSFFESDTYWTDFRKGLVNILSEQPLITKLVVTSFTFRVSDSGERIEYAYS